MTGAKKLDAVTEERILAVYAETHSKAETARQVGVHMNTVHKVVKEKEHRCIRCGKELTPQDRFIRCQECRLKIAANARAYRTERVRKGLCTECDNPVDPPSRRYCMIHRLKHIMASEQNHQKQQRNRMSPHGKPSPEQRERYVRHSYGVEALMVWRELNGACQICGIQHEQMAVHIHHIDKNRLNSERSNLTCLCQPCHRLVHSLTDHADPVAALAWIRATYPHLNL